MLEIYNNLPILFNQLTYILLTIKLLLILVSIWIIFFYVLILINILLPFSSFYFFSLMFVSFYYLINTFFLLLLSCNIIFSISYNAYARPIAKIVFGDYEWHKYFHFQICSNLTVSHKKMSFKMMHQGPTTTRSAGSNCYS